MKNEMLLPTGQEKKKMVQEMFDDIAPTYEKTNKIIALGMDQRARKIAFSQLRVNKGQTVLDYACGTGDCTRLLDSNGIDAISCDLSFGMLRSGKNMKNAVQCDGTSLPLGDNSVDGVICGYSLRNFVDLQSAFDEVMRVLKPGARFVAVDVSVPKNKVIRTFNKLWFAKLAPKFGWLISKNKQAYEYLPRSTAYLPEDLKIIEMLENSGAENTAVEPLVMGSLILITATKSPQLET